MAAFGLNVLQTSFDPHNSCQKHLQKSSNCTVVYAAHEVIQAQTYYVGSYENRRKT